MRHSDDHDYLIMMLLFGAILFILALLVAGWKPQPPPAWGEEPCLRATTDTYIRNYPPEGTVLNRRPAEWGTCPPFPPYQEP